MEIIYSSKCYKAVLANNLFYQTPIIFCNSHENRVLNISVTLHLLGSIKHYSDEILKTHSVFNEVHLKGQISLTLLKLKLFKHGLSVMKIIRKIQHKLTHSSGIENQFTARRCTGLRNLVTVWRGCMGPDKGIWFRMRMRKMRRYKQLERRLCS